MPSSADAIFKALSDPTRRAIFERLCREGPAPVSRLTEGAGISQPAVSKHLAILKRADLVAGREQGRMTQYSARPDALAVLADWTVEMQHFWNARLDRLDDLLKRMDQ
ncbi:winged helix-turn-helix transcriptional regulator [Paracoccus aurantiacus]|uniref:Winged helix-turn-helix transcriptional regulator n=1 Tax=Paracoccus aurantiacus TaxID=2599412 RepID=A0A5C6S8A4_9RHOB|nr:metalloregulator ArsR/SmtB family transcription factor [Paracoccus aurantiacus]TXB69982.1 winged helix-turn-helix transcriptional regulator [Paracoccus aurantiacus]